MKNRVGIIVIALLVIGVGVGVFVVLNSDSGSDDSASSTSTTASTEFEDTTTTVAVTTTVAPAASTTSTTAKTTTTTAKTTTTTAKATTTTGVVAACGTGQAGVVFNAKDLTTDAISSSFIPEAVVTNSVSQPIEVADITLTITYPTETKTVHFATAGVVIDPGSSHSFTSDKLTTAQRYTGATFTQFTYFTSGQQANCTVNAIK
ncbi:MAG TPA: hypothetical protein VFJ85_05230 [Acidimicrobiales bacterium]|nr:hypothetical protein [Acidimicrobiales bacterium]